MITKKQKMLKIFDWLFYLGIGYLLLTRFTQCEQLNQNVGKSLPSFSYYLEGKKITLGPKEMPGTIMFWASWCGPCKIEIKRIDSALAKGEIKKSDILALSINEEPALLKRFMEKRGYQVPYGSISSQGLTKFPFEIKGTPTFVKIDNGKFVEAWSGVHPMLISKIKESY